MTAPILAGAEPFSAEGDDRGVLVIHGFTGNPQSMRPVAGALADAGLTVELPRLPGHGTSVADMAGTGFDDWLGAVEVAYADLTGRCRAVALVGLSMGGALATWLAAEHPEVAGLVCMNAIVSPPAGMREVINEMVDQGAETMPGIGSSIAKEGVTEVAYDEVPLRPLLTLFDAASSLESRLGSVACPVLIVTSPQDPIVDPANSDLLASRVSGPVERVTAPDSYHVVTLDNDGPEVIERTVAFCEKVLADPGGGS